MQIIFLVLFIDKACIAYKLFADRIGLNFHWLEISQSVDSFAVYKATPPLFYFFTNPIFFFCVYFIFSKYIHMYFFLILQRYVFRLSERRFEINIFMRLVVRANETLFVKWILERACDWSDVFFFGFWENFYFLICLRANYYMFFSEFYYYFLQIDEQRTTNYKYYGNSSWLLNILNKWLTAPAVIVRSWINSYSMWSINVGISLAYSASTASSIWTTNAFQEMASYFARPIFTSKTNNTEIGVFAVFVAKPETNKTTNDFKLKTLWAQMLRMQ